MSVGAATAPPRDLGLPERIPGRARAEAAEAERLRPAAQRSATSAGRRWPEESDPYRTAYQRDRDRIIHSSAFRRLQYKTQVFINHEGDHFRTRLTHTLEVAQIARTTARTLRLNEDLTEAVALAHDLGHTPFGHAGEEVLDRLMAGHGGFEHNLQSYRIVTELERAYPGFPGLNLTRETRHGILAHSRRREKAPEEFGAFRSPPIEAQLADLADEIAYSAHDMEDGLASGLIAVSDLEASVLFRRHWSPAADGADRRVAVRRLLRGVIADLATDLIHATEERIRASGIERDGDDSLDGSIDGGIESGPESGAHPERAVLLRGPLAGLTPERERERLELKAILHECLYRHPRVLEAAEAGTRLLPPLFARYLEAPAEMPPHFRGRIETARLERVVCDYIAGMTDRFVELEHARLFPGSKPARAAALPRSRAPAAAAS